MDFKNIVRQLLKRFIFHQLIAEITNLTILRKITVYLHKRKRGKKKVHFKSFSQEKSPIVLIFDEMVVSFFFACLHKKLCILNKSALRKIHNSTIDLELCWFFSKGKMIEVFKKYKQQTKVHNSIIVSKIYEFCLYLVK